jgi:hypothetical protein
MPSEIEAYGDTSLFGIRVMFDAGNRDLLATALALFPRNDDALGCVDSVYVVLRTYDVNERVAESALLAHRQLSIVRDGIFLQVDGERGRGACVFPREAVASDAAKDAITTTVLFLVAQTGRIPVHASAVMLGETAIVMAGKSGAGKSVMALAANRMGLPVLSDDTVYVQMSPRFRVWARPHAIHVFEKDVADDAQGEMRFRTGRWKRGVPVAVPRGSADRSALCVLARGERVTLEAMRIEEAVDALTRMPEPGFDVYGQRAEAAMRALAKGGCWRLTLASNPDAAMSAVIAALAETAA